MADPVEPASSSPTGFHRVRRGETLSGLADGVRRHRAADLRAWNALGASGGDPGGPAAPRGGAAGRPRSPRAPRRAASTDAGRAHAHVRRGETLTGLAKRYGVSVQALREANGLSGEETLRPGRR